MQKVLLIKIEAPSYSSIGMEVAFKEHFQEVYSIDWQYERFNHGLAGLWDKIITTCENVKPDLIFCQIQKKDVLTIEQFKKMAEYGFVINYTEDVREDISWYEEVGEFIGLTIFTNKDDVERFKHKNVAFIPVSFNHIWYKPQPKTENNYGDIVFVGNNYVGTNLNFTEAKERQEMVAFMKNRFGYKFQAYGMGQENQMLLPAQVVEAYNNAKIVITQNNFKRDGYCSDRGVCAMGCGATVIHQHFKGIEEMFYETPYLITWDSFQRLLYLCEKELEWQNNNKHLSYSDKQVISDRTIRDHSWLNRVKAVMAFIKLLRPEIVFNEWVIEKDKFIVEYETETQCTPEHKIKNQIPTILELKYDGQVCDCGKIKWIAEDCGCSANPHLELKQYPNE